VQAVAASPAVLSTSPAAVAGSSAVVESLASSSSSSVADAGLSAEFTLDAATLEQLRGAGDAAGLMDASAVTTAAGFSVEPTPADDQPTMQVILRLSVNSPYHNSRDAS